MAIGLGDMVMPTLGILSKTMTLVITAIYCEQLLVSMPSFVIRSFVCSFNKPTYLLTDIISSLCVSSLVYAADVFNATFKLDPENTANDRRYRHAVLTKGASEDEMTILTQFLGRELDFYPFSQELNLS